MQFVDQELDHYRVQLLEAQRTAQLEERAKERAEQQAQLNKTAPLETAAEQIAVKTQEGVQESRSRQGEIDAAYAESLRFIDPQLEALRVQLEAEKRQALRQKPQQESIVAVAPSNKEPMTLPEVSKSDAVEVIKEPEPASPALPESQVTIADLSAQYRNVVAPFKSGEHRVIGVATDGILLNYGRNYGIHPVPLFPLKVGDKVALDQNGNISHVVPEKSKVTKKGVGE